MTTSNLDEIQPLLKEAVEILTAVDAPQDAARPLYYLAATHSFAGDSETSLAMIYRCLHATPPEDHLRLGQLYWLAGVQAYRMGFDRYAISLAKQAVDEAVLAGNYGLVAFNISSLAMIGVSHGEYAAAEQYLIQTRAARDRVESPGERAILDLTLNLLCSQVRIGMGRLDEAEQCLDRNLGFLTQQSKAAPDVFAQTLLQLAQIHSIRGQFELTRQQLRQATEVVEDNDEYLATAALRTPFENQRRNLYEVAISFEYDHDGKDAAWSYAQQYRSKLFLEFMRQTNPGIAGILDRAIDRKEVQELIPAMCKSSSTFC